MTITDNLIVSLPKLLTLEIDSFDDYQKNLLSDNILYKLSEDIEISLLLEQQGKQSFLLPGYCFSCQDQSEFFVDYQHSDRFINQLQIPNWRERLVCKNCNLCNRHRAVIQLLNISGIHLNQESKIYLSEQMTALYQRLKQIYPQLIGSEYLANKIPFGQVSENGIRNESLTNLTFNNNELDLILSFDCFEHIPDYQKALTECYRVLKTGGQFLFTVPFVKSSPTNIIRATIDSDGNITHIKTPQYHGDPLSQEGILCFQDFGWEMLDELRSIGFKKVTAILYWSRFYGYLGYGSIAFLAIK